MNFRTLSIISINLILILILSEIIAVSIHYFKHNNLFYSNVPQLKFDKPTSKVNLNRKTFLHPFFGYTLNYPDSRKGRFKINNFGFSSTHGDYPFVKTQDNQYIIAIFGGSVAGQFYAKGSKHITAKLKQFDFFKHKDIVILNFSQAGYKQPQQLLLLNYFLSIGQKFDLIINLDGFNDIALAELNHHNNIQISMPSSHNILHTMDFVNQVDLTNHKIALLAQINILKTRLNHIASIINTVPIASFNFISNAYYHFLFKQRQQAINQYEAIPLNQSNNQVFYLNKLKSKLSKTHLFDEITNLWVNSSILMHKTSISNNIKYLHILQPNQYFSKRIFSAKESKIAIHPEHKYRKAIEHGYPLLLGSVNILKSNGVNFHSAVDSLDNEQGIVFKDSCCHFNGLGIRLIVDFIVEKINTDKFY